MIVPICTPALLSFGVVMADFRHGIIATSWCMNVVYQGLQTGGGGGGWGESQPPLNFGWGGGVEHLLTPPDFEKKFLGGVASP